MELDILQNDNALKVAIIGAVDNENADELKSYFQDILQRNFNEAVFDLTYVPFITSSGIGKFLIFYKNIISKGQRMRIKGINDNLLDLFRSIKLDQLFPIEQ
ncbi:MAG: STAS domain-containing protein [Calditrichota bacterium]